MKKTDFDKAKKQSKERSDKRMNTLMHKLNEAIEAAENECDGNFTFTEIAHATTVFLSGFSQRAIEYEHEHEIEVPANQLKKG